MRKKSNAKVLEEIRSLKTKMKQGFTIETSSDRLFGMLRDFDLTEVKLTNGELTILCVRILHDNISPENNIVANAALQIIRTFSEQEGEQKDD